MSPRGPLTSRKVFERKLRNKLLTYKQNSRLRQINLFITILEVTYRKTIIFYIMNFAYPKQHQRDSIF